MVFKRRRFHAGLNSICMAASAQPWTPARHRATKAVKADALKRHAAPVMTARGLLQFSRSGSIPQQAPRGLFVEEVQAVGVQVQGGLLSLAMAVLLTKAKEKFDAFHLDFNELI